jgi:hypothetical protein
MKFGKYECLAPVLTGTPQVILDYVARSDGHAGGPIYQLFMLHPAAPAAPTQVTLQLRQAQQFGRLSTFLQVQLR